MNHWRARRLISGLLDDTLPEGTARRVEKHRTGCVRCQQALLQLRSDEALLHRLPLALLPLEPSPVAEARLASLARWALRTPVQDRLPYGVSAVGGFAMATLVALVIWAGSWAPVMEEEPSGTFSIAMTLTDSQVPPHGWR